MITRCTLSISSHLEPHPRHRFTPTIKITMIRSSTLAIKMVRELFTLRVC